MTEFKFVFFGYNKRRQMNDALAYLATDVVSAVNKCRELNPDFLIEAYSQED